MNSCATNWHAGDHSNLDDAAAGHLLGHLREQKYHFITPTPATHDRILRRSATQISRDLRDIFGWNRMFGPGQLEVDLFEALRSGGLLIADGDSYKSRVRVSSLGDDLLLHSAFPTDDTDAVFFGPDSYRFARLIADELARCPKPSGARLLDIGTGAGAGAIAAVRCSPDLKIEMSDMNRRALDFARVNARAAGVDAAFHYTSDLSAIKGDFDLILANPPYIIDAAGRAYRDGGGMHGGEVSLSMARQAVERLRPSGRFILYTGSAIVAGKDDLHEALTALATKSKCSIRYQEIDPDVFGEELESEAYHDVERIALVAAVLEKQDDAR